MHSWLKCRGRVPSRMDSPTGASLVLASLARQDRLLRAAFDNLCQGLDAVDASGSPSPTSSRKHVGWNWDCRAVPCITWPRLQTSLHELLQQTKKSKDHRSYYDATAAVQAMDEVLNLLSHRERESVCV